MLWKVNWVSLLGMLFGEFLGVDHVTEHTWTAMVFERAVHQHKVYDYGAFWVFRIWEHIELLQTMFLVLFLGINGREFQFVLSCPFFCQQKFLWKIKRGLLSISNTVSFCFTISSLSRTTSIKLEVYKLDRNVPKK